LNRTEKEETVAGLNTAFQDSDLVIVTHNNGLNATQTHTLRSQIRTSGLSYRVAKNRLAKIAIKGTNFEGLVDMLNGPTGLVMSKDPVAGAKVVAAFAKENPNLVIVGGVMGTSVLDAKGIGTLATLPSLDELRGKLIGLIQAPATKVAGVVQAPAGQLARLMQAYADKK
jgi:large subunit ribosomal protein L10